jgi:hypothetical protein
LSVTQDAKTYRLSRWWLVPVMVLIISWGLAHSSAVLTWGARYFTQDLLATGSLHIDKVEGSAFSHVTITGTTLATTDDSTQVQVDSVSIDFGLLQVLSGSIEAVHIAGVRADVTRRADGSFVFPELPPSESKTSFSVQEIHATKASAVIRTDSSALARIADSAIQLQGLVLGESIEARLDTLWAAIEYFDTDSQGLLGLSGSFMTVAPSSFAFSLDTERSSGHLSGSMERDDVGLKSFDLKGQGVLDMKDVVAFVPGLLDSEKVNWDITHFGTPDSAGFKAVFTTLKSGTATAEGWTNYRTPNTHAINLFINGLQPSHLHTSLESLTDLEGQLNVDLSEGNGYLALSMTKGTLGPVKLLPSTIESSLQNDNVSFSTDLNTSNGRLVGSGSLSPEGEMTSNWDFSDWSMPGDPTSSLSSNVNATLDLIMHLDGYTLTDATFSGRVEPSLIGDCTIKGGPFGGEYASDHVSVEGQMAGCRSATIPLDMLLFSADGSMSNLDLQASAFSLNNAGSVTLKARLDETQFIIEEGTLQNVDVFSLAGSEAGHSALNGFFSGESDLQAEMGTLVLHFDGSELNGHPIEGSADLRLSEGKVSAQISSQTGPDAHLNALLNWNPEYQWVTIQGALQKFDPFLLLDLDHESLLTGQFEADLKLVDAFPFEASIDLKAGSTLNMGEIEALSGSVRGDTTSSAGELKAQLERGEVRASYGLTDAFLFGTVNVQNADLAALAGLDMVSSITFNSVLNAERSEADFSDFSMEVDSLSGSIEGLDVHKGIARGLINDAGVKIDSLDISTQFGTMSAAGFLPLSPSDQASDLRYELTLNDSFNSFSFLQDQEIRFTELTSDGEVLGSFGALRLIADLSLMRPHHPAVTANSVQARVLAELGEDLRPGSAELTARLQLIEFGMINSESIEIKALYNGQEITTRAKLDLGDHGSGEANLSFSPMDSSISIYLNEFNAQLADDSWEMVGTSAFNLDTRQLQNPLVLISGEQRIIGVSSNLGAASRNLVSVQKVHIGPWAQLFSYPHLDGTFDGTITVAEDSSGIELQGSLNGDIQAFKQAAGALHLEFSTDQEGTRLSAGIDVTDEQVISLSGLIPSPESTLPVRLQLKAKDYPIDWIRGIMDPELMDRLKGRISGTVDVKGTSEAPFLEGSLSLTDGELGLPVLGKRRGMIVDDIQAAFRFEGDQILVDRLSASSGDGRITGEGSISIPELQLGEFDVLLSAQDFRAVDNHEYSAVVSGDMHLDGTTDRPELGGTLTVNRGDFWLSDATSSDIFEPITLSDADLATLQQRFGLRVAATDTVSFDAYETLTIKDLTVQMRRDTWVRSKSNPRLDIQLTGDLDVSKAPFEDALVFGSVSVLPERSRIVQFGQRFDLERGELTFNGAAETPDMSLEASYTVTSHSSGGEEVTIRLIAEGTPDELNVTFDSEPTMELSDIVSYIATGRPAFSALQISDNQGDAYLQSAAGLAIGSVTDLIENMAGSGLGLDVIEIVPSGLQGLTLTAGKYVSPKLYVSVNLPISLAAGTESTSSTNEKRTQVSIEYELVQQLLLSLLNKGTILRVNLRWQHAF